MNNEFDHPFYLGVLGGVGSTTWEGLVPSPLNRKALVISTPMLVQEGGPVWGVLAGYEFSPYFAIEGNYTSYPGAEVYFDTDSIYSYYNQGRTVFHSQTDAVSLMAKIMLIIPNTKLRLYSSAGATEIHRQDIIVDKWRLGPSFAVGLNYLISEHLMGEVAGNYATGYGEDRKSVV